MGGVGSTCRPARASRSARGSQPVLLARLRGGQGGPAEGGAPFTDRLVAKFGLPVAGWRGRPAGPGRANRAAGTAEQEAARPCLRKSASPGSA